MNLTAHFTLAELDRGGEIPANLMPNLRRVAEWLEQARAVGGVRLIRVSGYRAPARNAATPGASQTSDHPNALAADFTPEGITLEEWRTRTRAKLPAFDQVIFYPYTDGHVHVGLGSRMRNQELVALLETDAYGPIGSWDSETGAVTVGLLVGLVVAVLLLLVLGG